jgi:hypothetical protein
MARTTPRYVDIHIQAEIEGYGAVTEELGLRVCALKVLSLVGRSVLLTDVAFHLLYSAYRRLARNTTTEAFMTIMGKFIGGMLSVVGLIAFSIPTFGAEGSGGGKQDAQTSQQQRSDKMQQDQQVSDTQGGKQSTNTGADLTSGRDSHLGPQDAKGSQTQKKK